jgi:dihydropteroate synthase
MSGSILRVPRLPLRPGSAFPWGSLTLVMGIINVTPDSFSGDGVTDVETAVDQARRMLADGADILDVGGESSRPGHLPISEAEEMQRVLPVVRKLVSECEVPVSIDTWKPAVARAAVEAGASMINDIWGLKRGAEKAEIAAASGTFLVLMHNQDTTEYDDLVSDVIASLKASVAIAREAGVRPEQLIIDPGFGFGKTWEQNLELMRRLGELKALELPILVGTSRKSTIGIVLGLPVEDRLEGTAATVAATIANGADIVRVHDVRAMARVARMTDAIVRGVVPEEQQ